MQLSTNPIPDKEVMCHHTGFKRSCHDMVVKCHCPLWLMIAGANPNTGEPINGYGCADMLMPLLMIENSQQQRQTGAAVERTRNEIVRAADDSIRMQGGIPPERDEFGNIVRQAIPPSQVLHTAPMLTQEKRNGN